MSHDTNPIELTPEDERILADIGEKYLEAVFKLTAELAHRANEQLLDPHRPESELRYLQGYIAAYNDLPDQVAVIREAVRKRDEQANNPQ